MTQQGADRPTPYLSDNTPSPNSTSGFNNLPGSNLPNSLPMSQLPGLGQTPQPSLNHQQPNGGPSVPQQHAVVHNQQQYYPYPPQVPNHYPIQPQPGNTPNSNLPGQNSNQTPYPYPFPAGTHPQPSLNAPPHHNQPQAMQPDQSAQQPFINSQNNAPVSPVSPYMHTQPQYPQGHGTLVHSVPAPHNPAFHHSIQQPQQPQYVPVYTNVPGTMSGPYPGPYATQPQVPGQMPVYAGHPGESMTNPANPSAGHGYGLRHTIPPSQPVYRPVDVVVKQTQQGQALFAPSSQAVGPVTATAQQEKPSLFYEGPRSPPFFIKSRMNNLVLDARGTPDTIRQGTHLCVWPKKESDNSNQLWRWRQDGSIESFANPLLILDVEVSSGNVFLNSPTGSPSQKWTVTGHKFLVNRSHNHVLDIKGEGKDKATDVIVWQHHGKKNQQWTLEYLAMPFYIRCRKNGLVLDLANETTNNGTKVILANKKDHDPDSQLWRWKGFNIESVKAGKVLDLDSRNGNVILWRCHNGTNQQWIFDGDRLVNKEEDKVLDCDGKEHPGVQLVGAKPSTQLLQFFDIVS